MIATDCISADGLRTYDKILYLLDFIEIWYRTYKYINIDYFLTECEVFMGKYLPDVFVLTKYDIYIVLPSHKTLTKAEHELKFDKISLVPPHQKWVHYASATYLYIIDKRKGHWCKNVVLVRDNQDKHQAPQLASQVS